MPADLDSVADELYSLPRDEFTAARNAAAKRAREEGERELAEQIRELRRPSTAAWLVNLLAREQPDEVRALVELGDGLRAAQEQLEGDELRRLSRQRHELVHGLVQQARAIGRSAGHKASEATVRELEDTFTAAVNSSAAAQAVAGGRLTAALDPSDTGPLTTEPPSPPPQRRSDDRSDRDERLRRDLDRARAEAADADSARDDAERGLGDAERAADEAGSALQELRSRLEEAERAEHDARRRVRTAQRDLDAADRAAREAQRRVHDLERRLDR
ncbi:hypothetical protein [Pseudonocardia nigra]|uniref:hypothetical protein n=1 Tax=Pseudonocardia nigra TaxID=1921578 RepID=UPI001C5EA1CD|nr:hypothetical protein [Pseudonocardia nigra]